MKNSMIAALVGSLIFGFFFIIIASIFRAINFYQFGAKGFSSILIEGLILTVVFFVVIILFLKYRRKEKP
jgi:uncharacterized membrane protein YagU involved in acid resistance